MKVSRCMKGDEFAPRPMTAERLQALADSIDFSIL